MRQPQKHSYRNGFYDSGRSSSDSLPVLTATCKPVAYRGFLIFDRGNPHRFSKARDVHLVKDGVCVAMRSGVQGCKTLADRMLDEPAHFDAARSLAILARGQTAEAA